MLIAQGVSKYLGRRRVLENVNVSVRPGEVLGLIGPNGAGKTTLFQCLSGLLPMDAGEVRYSDCVIAPAQRKSVLYFVPDGIHPWPDQTVGWAVNFFERLFGRGAGEGARVAESLGLAHLMDSPLRWLSRGEGKRAALALGLLAPQPILLLDEPFEGLDLRQRRDVSQVLGTEARAGRTLFLSIHELGHAARVCDRLVLLSAGRAVGEGTLDELRVRTEKSDIEEIFLALT